MAHPYLDGLYIIFCVQGNPRLAEFAQYAFAVEFPYVGVVRKYDASLVTSVRVLTGTNIFQDGRWRVAWHEYKYSRLLSEAAFSVGVPGDGAVGGVRPQTNPLVTGRTQHTVSFKLSNVRVSA